MAHRGRWQPGQGNKEHPESLLERTRREIQRHSKGKRESSRGYNSCLQDKCHVVLNLFSGSPRRDPREMGSGDKGADLDVV